MLPAACEAYAPMSSPTPDEGAAVSGRCDGLLLDLRFNFAQESMSYAGPSGPLSFIMGIERKSVDLNTATERRTAACPDLAEFSIQLSARRWDGEFVSYLCAELTEIARMGQAHRVLTGLNEDQRGLLAVLAYRLNRFLVDPTGMRTPPFTISERMARLLAETSMLVELTR